MITALILLSAVLHASWNAFVKSDEDPAISMAWIMGIGGLASLATLPFIPWPTASAWPYLIATTVLQNAYFAFVILSYRNADLSQAYPIARGTAALAAAIASSFLGIDVLAPREWFGIFISSLGIASLAFSARGSSATVVRSIGYPLMSGLFTASYSIVDGTGAKLAGSAFVYIVWLNLCASPFLPLYAWLNPHAPRAGAKPTSLGKRFIAAAVALASYGIAVWALSHGSIGRIAVLRETSVLFAAILGSVVLKEPFGRRRILSAIVILLGFAIWP